MKNQFPLEKDYEINLSSLLAMIRKKKPKRIGLQLPEGLKTKTIEIIKFFEKETGAEVILSIAPCYGACDLRLHEFQILGIDLVLHFGHSEMPILRKKHGNWRPDIIFVELRAKIDKEKIRKIAEEVKKHLKKKGEKVVLTASLQYIHVLSPLKTILEKEHHVHIYKGDSHLTFPGQVLGCNFSAAGEREKQEETVVFIGNGQFHPLGIKLATGKDVIAVDPGSCERIELLPERYLKSRVHALSLSLNAERFGILISTKEGQMRIHQALSLKKKLEKAGKEAFLFFENEISPQHLRYIKVDAFVSTLCPRFAFDEAESFLRESKKPLLTPQDVEILIKYFQLSDVKVVSNALEDYRVDEIREEN